MKHGQATRLAPKFLVRLTREKTGPQPKSLGDFFRGKIEPVSKVSRRVVHVVGWMLIGFIIAGYDLSYLYAQDAERQGTRAESSTEEKSATTNAAPSISTPRPPAKVSAPSKSFKAEIVLPDIYIAVPEKALPSVAPADTLSTLTRQLKNAELELSRLQLERQQLLKNIEQLSKRQVKGVNRAAEKSAELLGRPSV